MLPPAGHGTPSAYSCRPQSAAAKELPDPEPAATSTTGDQTSNQPDEDHAPLSFLLLLHFLPRSLNSLSCVAANEQGSLHPAKLCSRRLLLFAPGPTSRRRPLELQGNSHGAMTALISHADHLRGIFSDKIRRGPTIPVVLRPPLPTNRIVSIIPCAPKFQSVRSVRIRSTTLVRLLHGLDLLPSGISGKMNIFLDTITIIAMIVI